MKIGGYKLTRFGRRVFWTAAGCGMAIPMAVGAALLMAGANGAIIAVAMWAVGSAIGGRIATAVADRMTGGDRASLALTESPEERAMREEFP